MDRHSATIRKLWASEPQKTGTFVIDSGNLLWKRINVCYEDITYSVKTRCVHNKIVFIHSEEISTFFLNEPIFLRMLR